MKKTIQMVRNQPYLSVILSIISFAIAFAVSKGRNYPYYYVVVVGPPGTLVGLFMIANVLPLLDEKVRISAWFRKLSR